MTSVWWFAPRANLSGGTFDLRSGKRSEPGRKPDVKSLEIPINESRTVVFKKTVPIRGAGNGAELLGQVQLKLLPEDNWPANNKGQGHLFGPGKNARCLPC